MVCKFLIPYRVLLLLQVFESSDDDDLDAPPKRSSGLRSAGNALRTCLKHIKQSSSKVVPLQLQDKELEDDDLLSLEGKANGTAEEASQWEEIDKDKFIDNKYESSEPAEESSFTDEGHTPSSDFNGYNGTMTSQLCETREDEEVTPPSENTQDTISNGSCIFDSEEDTLRVAHAVPCAISLNVAAVEEEQEDEEVTPPSETTQDTISNGSCIFDSEEGTLRVAHAVPSAISLNVAAVEDEQEDEQVTPPSENTHDTISNGSCISDSEEDTLRVAHAVASAISLNVAAVEDEQEDEAETPPSEDK